MLIQVFAIYDSKAAAYLHPMFFPTGPAAQRAFTDECLNPQSLFSKHPEDYTLFHLGEYDDSNGVLKSLTPKAALISALEARSNFFNSSNQNGN